jgi:DNA-directed RNA polymerase sigma subunit (sigma70/sigma32)
MVNLDSVRKNEKKRFKAKKRKKLVGNLNEIVSVEGAINDISKAHLTLEKLCEAFFDEALIMRKKLDSRFSGDELGLDYEMYSLQRACAYPDLSDKQLRFVEWCSKNAKGAYQDMARSLLVEHLGKFIFLKVREKNFDYSMLELFNEGVRCALHGVEKYDYDVVVEGEHVKFISYIAFWIEQGLNRCVANNSRTIRIPIYMQDFKRKYDKLISQAEINGDDVDVEYVVEKLNCSEAIAKVLLNYPTDTYSTDLDYNDDGESTLLDFVGVKDWSVDYDKQRDVASILEENLSDMERDIICKRYGIGGTPIMKLREIGEEYGCTRAWIQIIQARALRRLRTISKFRGLNEYLE